MVVIGVGNVYRRDDAAGLIAARRLWEAARDAVILHEAIGEGTTLLDAWRGAETAILIDAVCSGAPAGTIHRVEAHAETVPAGLFRYSTHAFNVAEAVELARALHRLPPRLILFGVEGGRFEAGVGLSPEVEQAVDEVVRRGLEEIARARQGV